MSISGIQGQLLEVTVVECSKLKDTEWFSRQDPYVCLEYGRTKFRTRTCTDGGRNPKFQEKFMFSLIDGLREINVMVWNSNTITHDDLIGSGKVQLQEVLSRGYDDKTWSIYTKTGRYAGEVKLIMHYPNANKQASGYPSAPPYSAPSQPHITAYSLPPLTTTASHLNPSYSSPVTSNPSYPTLSSAYQPPPYPSIHSSSMHPSYPPPSSAYPPPSSAYPPPPDPSIHSPSMHHYPASYSTGTPYLPPAYPAPPYPPGPPPSAYPGPPYPPPGPPPHAYPYGPPTGHYGTYPPPPY